MSTEFHPTDAELSAWLDETEVRDDLDQHVETCVHCADRLEQIDGGDSPVAAALEEATRPPDDLRARIDSRLAQAELSRRTTGLMTDLLGTGLKTLGMLTTDPPRKDS